MRLPSFSAILSKVLCACLSLLAQQASPPRDPLALAAVQRAVAVTGGTGPISQIHDCVAEGTLEPSPGSWLSSGTFVWKNSGSEFRYENPGVSGRSAYVSGRGRPAVVKPDGTTRLHAHVSEANFPPHLFSLVLLRMLADARYKLVFVGEQIIGDRPVLRVRSSLAVDEITAVTTVQDWFFDAGSGLPVRVEYRLPANSNALEYLSAAVELADFRSVSGLAVPFQITIYQDGQKGGIAKLSSVVFNTGISTTDFDAPNGGGQ